MEKRPDKPLLTHVQGRRVGFLFEVLLSVVIIPWCFMKHDFEAKKRKFVHWKR